MITRWYPVRHPKFVQQTSGEPSGSRIRIRVRFLSPSRNELFQAAGVVVLGCPQLGQSVFRLRSNRAAKSCGDSELVDRPIAMLPRPRVTRVELGGGRGDWSWLERELAIVAERTDRPWGVGFLSWSADVSVVEQALEYRPTR